jgi:hypothetical protein
MYNIYEYFNERYTDSKQWPNTLNSFFVNNALSEEKHRIDISFTTKQTFSLIK